MPHFQTSAPLVRPPKEDETTPYTILEQHTFLDLDEDGYSALLRADYQKKALDKDKKRLSEYQRCNGLEGRFALFGVNKKRTAKRIIAPLRCPKQTTRSVLTYQSSVNTHTKDPIRCCPLSLTCFPAKSCTKNFFYTYHSLFETKGFHRFERSCFSGRPKSEKDTDKC